MPHDLIVLVPGITGSVLRKDDGPLWDLSVAAIAHGVVRTAQVLDDMRLPADLGDDEPDARHRLAATGLIKGWHVWPGFWGGSGYGRLIRRLRQLHPDPDRMVEFSYDWRLSNRRNARCLAAAVEPALAAWRSRPGNGGAKAVFVCHSMGGLIVRYYLEVLGGREDARRLITLGTPHSGSIRAIQALAGGLVPPLRRLDERLIGVARTFPAVRQLLPTYMCVNTDGGPRGLGEVDVPDLATAAAQDAYEFSREINQARERNGSPAYEIHAFGGRKQPTEQSISIGARGILYHRQQRGVDHAGDGTVPLFSAVPPEASNTAAGIYHAARHSGLQRHGELIDQVIDKVNGVDLGETLAPSYELTLNMPNVGPVGHPICVTVTADHPELRLHVNVRTFGGTVRDSNIPLPPDGLGNYHTSLRLPPGSWDVEVEAIGTASPPRVSDFLLIADDHDA
jgi:hypothetical protein